jgi:hypothetical protein
MSKQRQEEDATHATSAVTIVSVAIKAVFSVQNKPQIARILLTTNGTIHLFLFS